MAAEKTDEKTKENEPTKLSQNFIFFALSAVIFFFSLTLPVMGGYNGFFAFFGGWLPLLDGDLAGVAWLSNFLWILAAFFHIRKKYFQSRLFALIGFIVASLTFVITNIPGPTPSYGASDFQLKSGFYLWYTLFILQLIFESYHVNQIAKTDNSK